MFRFEGVQATVSYTYDCSNEMEESPENQLYWEETSPAKEKEVLKIPLCIFSHGLSGLRAIVKYLKEEENLTFTEIAKLLSRDQRTIWTEYYYSKNHKKFSPKLLGSEKIFLLTSIFADRNFSILESLCVELHERGFSQKQISQLLDKSPKTIWTVLRRADEKAMKVAEKYAPERWGGKK